MIELSVIILSWNTRELLKQCLESVIRCWRLGDSGKEEGDTITHRPSPITEVILVDNGSTDGSVEMVKEFIGKYSCQFVSGPKSLPKEEKASGPLIRINSCELTIKLIENRTNLGFAKGNNIGIKTAKGEYIMLLNSDTVVQEGAMKSLIDFLRSFYRDHPCQQLRTEGNKPISKSLTDRVEPCRADMAVSPFLLLPDRKPQTDYYMRFPNLWQVFFYHNPALRSMVMKMPVLSSLIAQKSLKLPFEVDQLPGAALLAHRDVWSKVGLLDENYHFLFEDVDWCWRAKKLGVKLMVVPKARIIHIGGASWKNKLTQDKSTLYYQFFASMLLFVRKNYSKKSTIFFKWAIISNFILTLKFKLAVKFIKNKGIQCKFLN